MHIQEKNKLSNMEKELSSLIEPNDLSHVTELDKLKDDNNPWIDMKVMLIKCFSLPLNPASTNNDHDE